uniref:Uncharacterized protein n=1 Tax=Setaria italica TaxID=4555 RepID=K3YXL1_SETIT
MSPAASHPDPPIRTVRRRTESTSSSSPENQRRGYQLPRAAHPATKHAQSYRQPARAP